ncbi:MAG: cell division protein FtsA [Duncaniella sp.]|nr:cell division protein FtsA [Duncaniella sp.]
MEEKYIVALEIGSSKIKGAVGTVDSTGGLSVKDVEEERLLDGVRYGCIRNVVETANAVRSVISRLEQREPQRTVTGVYVSVGGRSLTSQAIEIERHLSSYTEITMDMITDIINDALGQTLHERSIVSVTPREFLIDNTPTDRPVGMMGSHITARLNIISCRNQLIRNLNNVIDERLHLKIHDIYVRQLVEGDLVLSSEEKRLGCMLVDFGAETTTVSIYKNGVLEYLSTIPMGSRNITRDITALNHLEERAEELKIAGGNALPATDHVQIHNNYGSSDYSIVNNYVAARAGEIILNINEQMKYAGYESNKLPAGIVMIGKGTKLNGFSQRLENITGMKTRVGAPHTRIRINDGKIQSADAVDVISILAAAAKNKPKECMRRPEPEQPKENGTTTIFQQQPTAFQQPQAQPQQAPHQPMQQPVQQQPAQQPIQQPIHQQQTQQPAQQTTTTTTPSITEPANHNGHRPRVSILERLKDRLANLMTEPIEEDEDNDDE